MRRGGRISGVCAGGLRHDRVDAVGVPARCRDRGVLGEHRHQVIEPLLVEDDAESGSGRRSPHGPSAPSIARGRPWSLGSWHRWSSGGGRPRGRSSGARRRRQRPILRGMHEAFCSRLFGAGVTRTNALKSLVISGWVQGLSDRDIKAGLADLPVVRVVPAAGRRGLATAGRPRGPRQPAGVPHLDQRRWGDGAGSRGGGGRPHPPVRRGDGRRRWARRERRRSTAATWSGSDPRRAGGGETRRATEPTSDKRSYVSRWRPVVLAPQRRRPRPAMATRTRGGREG
jgi:hypothetical protein